MKIILPGLQVYKSFFLNPNRLFSDLFQSLLFPKGPNSAALKQIRSTILLSSIASFLILFSATGQNLKGQWIGNFNSAVGTDLANKTDYIIEIENRW